jgi:RNA ligase
MNYKFPEIRTIDDVLPHIEGRPEFIVAEREFGTVVNYVVAMTDTFNMNGPDDLGGAIRRECRGLIFDTDGKIMSRPFHKFFNIGQVEETQPHQLDFTRKHLLMNKLDGSFLRPIMLNGKIRWGTKMGFSEVAEDAEIYLAKHPKYAEFAAYCFENMLTPVFEYVGPHNKVVLNYEENMILLAVREMITGKYLDIHGAF